MMYSGGKDRENEKYIWILRWSHFHPKVSSLEKDLESLIKYIPSG